MTGVSLERLADTLYPKPEPKNSTAYGTVESINPDGSYQVKLNASATTTRCAKLCDAEVTDRVLVLIQANGHCAAIGRVGGSPDRIVEQGTADGWTYRKWESGTAECWGRFSHTLNCNSGWGSLYETASAVYETFPAGLFTVAPTVSIDWEQTSGSTLLCLEMGAGLTSSRTQQFWGVRATSGSSTGYAHVIAKGRWK